VRVKASKSAGRFDVSDDGRGLENWAGVTLPAQVANHVGLTGGLRGALSGVRSWRDHDPGGGDPRSSGDAGRRRRLRVRSRGARFRAALASTPGRLRPRSPRRNAPWRRSPMMISR
jgi:hypothetical protein